MFENNLRTKLEPYLLKKIDFDPNLLPDLSRRKFFQRDEILKYLERYKLNELQLQDFLSISYEKILDENQKKQENFLKAFEKDLTKFSKDRAVIANILNSHFEDSQRIFQLLSKLEEIKIEQGSVEAFDLVSRYIESTILNGLAYLNAKKARVALASVEVLAQFLDIELKPFNHFFQEIADKFKKNIRLNSAKVIADFANNL